MKKIVDVVGWVCVVVTVAILIMTLLTTYQFIYLKYFNTYKIIQICIFFTMITWAIKMYIQKSNSTNIVYPLLCMILAVGTIFFMYVGVY
ncbi:hypothetical protein ACFIJ5_15010 [Haloimpatiens sp. FM7330]|uniref:hypothetical protein n=1 Tax=Haloimpatiens sp. FM7330 TaxID=3298610 RepID=UPI00362D7B49